MATYETDLYRRQHGHLDAVPIIDCHEHLQRESELLTRAYWTALLPHGMKPENDRYIIVYLPGFTTEQAAAWWAEQPFEILQQDNLAHRERDRRTGAILSVRQWVGAGVEL